MWTMEAVNRAERDTAFRCAKDSLVHRTAGCTVIASRLLRRYRLGGKHKSSPFLRPARRIHHCV